MAEFLRGDGYASSRAKSVRQVNAISTLSSAGADEELTGMSDKTSLADSMLGIGAESSTHGSFTGNHAEYKGM